MLIYALILRRKPSQIGNQIILDGLFHFTHVDDICKIGTCQMPVVQISLRI